MKKFFTITAIAFTTVTFAQTGKVGINTAHLTTGSTTVLITYSALALPNAAGAPVQGSINLIVDGVKTISSYYASMDAQMAV
ncbi:hypothetical protein HHL23_04465 [Chryseobacterium sp. RP-3-3]|uniref:Uncharacterized protein n=1 Tax=Chryseobacterium antibioticum TaxID=2728847 RepID=A0A7Y0FQU3_9FLAO|nr:hypothetical protein [Chryseobacterium antibioticum]NML69045.1 hypothetical protein [Chryseobacterium antibioticum]